jgi:hypothetical protein
MVSDIRMSFELDLPLLFFTKFFCSGLGGVKDNVASTNAGDKLKGPSTPAKKRKRIFERVKESMNQTELEVFKGISILFNEVQKDPV